MLLPPYDSRVAIIGATGTGKSTLGRELTIDNDRLFVVDSKRSPAIAEWPDLESWEGPTDRKPAMTLRNAVRTVVTKGSEELERAVSLQKRMVGSEPFRAWLRPPISWRKPEKRGEMTGYEKLWYWIFENVRHCTVYIDEMYLTLESKGNGGDWLQALYSQGRERHIGMLACMQRPVWVPKECRTESEYYYIFRLNDSDDITLMEKAIGRKAKVSGLTGHQIITYNASNGDVATFDKVDISG